VRLNSDRVTAPPPGGGSEVPEPSTMALAGVGGAVLVAARKRTAVS
jgi:hypothetical protein